MCTKEWPDPEVQTQRDIGRTEIAGDPTVSTHGREYSLTQEYKDNCNRTEQPDVSGILFWSWFPSLGFSVR